MKSGPRPIPTFAGGGPCPFDHPPWTMSAMPSIAATVAFPSGADRATLSGCKLGNRPQSTPLMRSWLRSRLPVACEFLRFGYLRRGHPPFGHI